MPELLTKNSNENISGLQRLTTKFGSQYLYYTENGEEASEIDIVPNPGTPMMSRANDGW